MAGNLIRHPKEAQVVCSYGNDKFTKFSDWGYEVKKNYNELVYLVHPKKLIVIYEHITIATLGCTNVPSKPYFGSSCDFFCDGPLSNGKIAYSSPGLFAWKTGTIPYKEFFPGVFPINPRSPNEKLFLESLTNIENPTWENFILEAENHQQLVFEVEQSPEKPE